MEMLFDISQEELPIFLAEVDEHLQVLDEYLVQMERVQDDPELLQKLFRAAHTMKGSAGMIGHHRMTRLTHAMETAFDGLRNKTISISTPLIDLCLESVDTLRALREEVITHQACDVDVDRLVIEFAPFNAAPGPTSPPAKGTPPAVKAPVKTKTPAKVIEKPAVEPQPAAPIVESAPVTGAGERKLQVHALIDATSVASAARAFQLMMALQEFGELISMSPTLEQIETASPVRDFTAELITATSEEVVHKALKMVSEVEKISFSNGNSTPTAAQVAIDSIPQPAALPDASPTPVAQAAVPAASPARPGVAPVKSAESKAEMTVRTSVERLDNLMNLVGELITDRNHLNQIRNRLEMETRGIATMDVLSETVAHLARLTDQLQEEVMRIRMLPISNVFNKFPRMVRDMAQKTGKQIDLVIHGEDTELDRSMIEYINDPLIHLVRNSVDHGVETPEERLAAGKPERGVITMTARHEQGRVILTVEDDGKGIDTARVRRSAVRKGLISEEEANALTEEQAVDLIFLPGLSTAKEVTDISGRGVGMDIVHTNIQRVNGTIQVETWPGKGSVFMVILPLTLAIVPTLLVKVERTTYAIPLVTVTETLRLTKADIKTVRGKPVTLLRGNVLPILYLEEVFEHNKTKSGRKHYYVVVVNSGKLKVGLVVDSLTGEEEVVVKSLGSLVGEIPGVSSAAILGDGTVALIVDIPGMFKYAGLTKER